MSTTDTVRPLDPAQLGLEAMDNETYHAVGRCLAALETAYRQVREQNVFASACPFIVMAGSVCLRRGPRGSPPRYRRDRGLAR